MNPWRRRSRNGTSRRRRFPASTTGAPAVKAGPAPTTPWGEPDLQGIWSRDSDEPLQRPAKYGNKEFLTDEERAALDKEISVIVGREAAESRRQRGTEQDVGGAYNAAVFTSHLRTGRRTSMIVDPPDGKIPPLTPEELAIFYDVGQGQGWQRIIPVTAAPHLPANVRQWWGDSRGRWDGKTLVVDVTNFSPKSNYLGAHENLHLVERWTRLDAETLEYAVTIEDSTVWTRPWTVKLELKRQSDKANRLYSEPRCHEGNYGMPALLAGARADERAFAKRTGPDPATQCLGGCGGFAGGFADEGEDTNPAR